MFKAIITLAAKPLLDFFFPAFSIIWQLLKCLPFLSKHWIMLSESSGVRKFINLPCTHPCIGKKTKSKNDKWIFNARQTNVYKQVVYFGWLKNIINEMGAYSPRLLPFQFRQLPTTIYQSLPQNIFRPSPPPSPF